MAEDQVKAFGEQELSPGFSSKEGKTSSIAKIRFCHISWKKPVG